MVDYENGHILSFTSFPSLESHALLSHTYLHFYSDLQYLRPMSHDTARQGCVSPCHDTIDEQGARSNMSQYSLFDHCRIVSLDPQTFSDT